MYVYEMAGMKSRENSTGRYLMMQLRCSNHEWSTTDS